jgi:hypothetical protein
MQPIRPPHKKYLLHGLNDDAYFKYAKVYGISKKVGVRGIYAFLTGTGLWSLVKESLKGAVIYEGKKRLSMAIISSAFYVSAPCVLLITNATKVVKLCKITYTGIGYVGEVLEDSSHIPFLLVDFLVFGQPIKALEDRRYSKWSNITDLIQELPFIGDD